MTDSAQRASVRGAPDPRPQHPIPLALGASKKITFILAEAWQTNTNPNTGWFALHLIPIPLIKKRGSSRRWRRWRRRTKTMMRMTVSRSRR
jgi:hypothetical protein